MSAVKPILDSLLWDIYGKQRQHRVRCKRSRHHRLDIMASSLVDVQCNVRDLEKLGVLKLIDVCAILKVEIHLMAYLLERVLIARDRNRRHQDVLCGFVDAILHLEFYDVHPKMRFSLSPPPPKAIFSSNVTPAYRCSSDPVTAAAPPRVPKSQYHFQHNNNTINIDQYAMQRQEDSNNSNSNETDKENSSDYKQWLHAMKLVARLPGGIPPEFRRKLWLSLADKYLKSKNVNWTKEEEKCFCEKWREDDEELGIQIVKDLHRTGSTLCTGPAGDINQAKLKRILLGYARYNPEVGYCQGFNMLGALILQVMDKEESESIKVMIYLVEGILPTGYFCGSMGGLQADMAVFRELMQTKLPRLAKHLQKLQGPMENAFEPPLTNVFTMQWFLTMFCTCLPMSCVLRVWDLVLIEGSDVLLRTALALWSLLEERVLSTRSADDFYGKMGSFSSELLNGHLIDSNGLIEKVVQLGPIPDIQKLRDKHLYNIAPLRNQQGINLYYDEDEPDMDEDSRLAVATVWGIPWGRRGSQGQTAVNLVAKQVPESKDRIALDISLLKKQYDRLRERQKQAHIIITTACSTARQGASSNVSNAPVLPVNQLLSGRSAIVTNKGRRSGPPIGSIPPARKPSLPAVLQEKPLEKHLRRGETLNWRNNGDTSQRRDSLSWKEIKAERAAMITSGSVDGLKSQKIRSRRLGKSDSSSYSEDSDDDNDNKGGAGSSTDTSLCDDDNPDSTSGRKKPLDLGNNQRSFTKFVHKTKKISKNQRNLSPNIKDHVDRKRPKSWAPSNSEIPFVLMTIESPNNSADENSEQLCMGNKRTELLREGENSSTENDKILFKEETNLSWKNTIYSPIAGDLAISNLDILSIQTDSREDPGESASTTIVIGTTPNTNFMDSTNSLGSNDGREDEVQMFDVSDEGVTNEYFERVNSTERPTKLDLLYSLNEEDSIRDAYKEVEDRIADSQPHTTCEQENNTTNVETLNTRRCMDLLVDYSEKSSAACIAEAKTEISSTLQTIDASAALSMRKEPATITDETVLKRTKVTAAEKRRNPRRLTLTRSSTMDIEKRYQALEKRLSMEVSSKYKPFFGDIDNEETDNQRISFIKDDEANKIPLQIKYNETSNTKRKIPSTADLEERFKNMQLHLVGVRADSYSPCDSENTGQNQNGESRKISLTENTKNGSLNGKNSDETEKETNIEKDKICGNKTMIKESDLNKNSSTKGDINEGGNANDNLKAKISPSESDLKQIPEKSNVLKSKKEPPDNNKKGTSSMELELDENESDKTSPQGTGKDISQQNTNISEDHVKQVENIEQAQESSKSIKVSKDKVNIRDISVNSKESDEKLVKNINTNVKTTETDKNSTENIDNRSQIDEDKDDIKSNTLSQNSSSNSAQRKSPPSTEELEKRFSALEKQMSVNKQESDEVKHEDEIPYKNSMSENNNGKAPANREANQNNTAKNADNKVETILSAANEIFVDNAKRRLSEPPSTEDLEKRYEVLKRRMSSRNFETTSFAKGKNIHVKNDVDKELLESKREDLLSSKKANINSPPSTENLEKRYEELQSKSDRKELGNLNTKQSPPSTENLEKRYEELQNKSDDDEAKSTTTNDKSPSRHSPSSAKNIEKGSHIAKTKQSPPSTENLEKRYEELQNKTDNKETKKSVTKENSVTMDSSPTIEAKPYKEPQDNSTSESTTTKDADQNKVRHIQEIQAKAKSPVLDSGSRQKRTALIAELQNKIKATANGEPVKPSSINPTRRPPAQNVLLASKSFNDETSETHATSAYSRSGKYELRNSSSRKMVRRFSDLPSRADLENRLQFLEEQLSKTLRKQRRSSDSEVASKQHRSEHNITFSNVTPPPLSGSLESRVQELEKHLGEKRALLTNIESSQPKNLKHAQDSEIEISQIADTLAVTGKELVRYSQFGDGEFDHQNPINISINIQMTLNKDDAGNKKMNDLPKAEELDRRLQILEQQLKTPHSLNVSQTANQESNLSEPPVHENKTSSTHTIDLKCDSIEITKQTEKHCEMNENTDNDSPPTIENLAQETNQKCLEEPVNKPKDNIADIADSKINDDEKCYEKESKKENESEKLLLSQNLEAKAESEVNDSKVENEPAIEKKISQADSIKKVQDETEENTKSQKNEASGTVEEIKKSEEQTEIQKNEVTEEIITEDLQQVQNKLTAKEGNGTETKKNEEIQRHLNQEENKSEEIAQKNLLTDVSSKTMGSSSQMVPIEVNKKTLVLLLDNEPKAVKVRRLTRANTEELEDLFQALEKQISERGQVKTDERLVQSNEKIKKTTELEIAQAMANLTKEIHEMHERGQIKADKDQKQQELERTQAMADSTKEIHEFSKSEKTKPTEPSSKEQHTPKKQEEFDWGADPIKYHLKKKTVYLPSTKELEARFRSLERQIMLLEHVEKIDVEQRLTEIERKIKLQYSLSHEKDLNKFLELCEGKGLDDISPSMEKQHERKDCSCSNKTSDQKRLPTTSPKHTSPKRSTEPIPSTGNLEYRYRALDLKRSRSKQNLKKEPIHPLEMLLDPSPDDSNIPTTGELEHRMRVMEEQRYTPSPPSRKSRSQSPPKPKSSIHKLEAMVTSPAERDLPTAEELEARLDALEKEQCFNFKMQKNFQQFNQKLKDVVSPSLSFDEPIKSCESESKNIYRSSSPRSVANITTDSVSPKTIRFLDDEQQSQIIHRCDNESMVSTNNDVIQILEENSKIIQRILKKTIADSHSSFIGTQQTAAVHTEGLGVMGIRLMRETSPLRRKGTHTGVPLRTGENINDQLTSIKNTIKSIDSLCEEKPYRKERCQQYIDALFSDSTYFATKKSSLEDLTSRNISRSTSRDIGPSIRISDHSPAFTRSMGSADSIRSSSPLRPTSPLQYRSNRDLRREPSPRRRREEDREEHESRVRRDNLLPNNINFNHSTLSHSSHSLTKFHKVDSQLIPNDIDVELDERLRHPTFSLTETMVNHDNNTNTSNTVNTPTTTTTTNPTYINEATTSDTLKSNILDRPTSTYRQTGLTNSNTPVYTPAKLEIRHTTVTSTFYDRVLTEKQLEKQQQSNRSPMVSPLFERHVRPSFQTNTSSPTKVPHQESANTMILSEASPGNYRTYQPNINANNDG